MENYDVYELRSYVGAVEEYTRCEIKMKNRQNFRAKTGERKKAECGKKVQARERTRERQDRSLGK